MIININNTMSNKDKATYDFGNYKKDAVTKPRDIAWSNWKKFDKVGDVVQGFIRDAFYRKAEGMFKAQRGITLEQPDGTLINVGIKRFPFVLAGTDDFRIGDPLTIEFTEEKPAATKGFSPTKIFSFYGRKLPENTGKTIRELDREDMLAGGTSEPENEEEIPEGVDEQKPEDIPFAEGE